MKNKKAEEPMIGTDFNGCEGSDDSSMPEAIDNKIYFYCDVSTSTVLEFNKKIRDLDQRNYVSAVARQNPFDSSLNIDPIIVYIQSPGGTVFSGLSAMDAILQCKSPIYTVIDGAVASAATFMSVVGTKRFITPHSFALIHQLSQKFWGPYDEIKDEVINLDMFMDTIREVYIRHTKISGTQLEEILKHDIFFNATKCLELGIVDYIK